MVRCKQCRWYGADMIYKAGELHSWAKSGKCHYHPPTLQGWPETSEGAWCSKAEKRQQGEMGRRSSLQPMED